MRTPLIGREELRFLLFSFSVMFFEIGISIYFGEAPKFTGFNNEQSPRH